MTLRPKTGEKRQVRQPLSIDKLPEDVRDEIRKLRVAGYTWSEIEERSAKFVKWESLSTRVLELFPEMHIPRSNLQRWYDLRVEQVMEETAAQAERARVLADAMSKQAPEGLDKAVLNALRDQVFSVFEAADSSNRQRLTKELMSFFELLQIERRNDIRQEAVTLEGKKVSIAEKQLEIKKNAVDKVTNEAARKIGKGKGITVDDINRIRERTFGLPPVQRSASTGNPA